MANLSGTGRFSQGLPSEGKLGPANFDCSCFNGIYVTGGITDEYLSRVECSKRCCQDLMVVDAARMKSQINQNHEYDPPTSETPVNEVVRHCCELKMVILQWDSTPVLYSLRLRWRNHSTDELEKIVGLVESQENLSCNYWWHQSFHTELLWKYDIESGCEMIFSHPMGYFCRLIKYATTNFSTKVLLGSISCNSPVAINCSGRLCCRF